MRSPALGFLPPHHSAVLRAVFLAGVFLALATAFFVAFLAVVFFAGALASAVFFVFVLTAFLAGAFVSFFFVAMLSLFFLFTRLFIPDIKIIPEFSRINPCREDISC